MFKTALVRNNEKTNEINVSAHFDLAGKKLIDNKICILKKCGSECWGSAGVAMDKSNLLSTWSLNQRNETKALI